MTLSVRPARMSRANRVARRAAHAFTIAAAALLLSLPLAPPARANHGPGASGGGSSTVSGEVLKPGTGEVALREDYSQFEHFSRSAAIERARQSGDFDALGHGFLATLSLAYGVVPDVELAATIGYFHGQDFIGADLEESGDVNVGTANPSGLTDLAVIAKWRVVKGYPGNVALLGGVKAPTGNNDVRLSNGELLSPTDQPGSGAWDFPVGVGYSRFLTPRITVDAGGVYTFRTTHDGFKVGDRVDFGVALAYRLTESIKRFPQYSVFVEANDVWLQPDRSDEEGADPNSGGNTLYLTPGARVRFSPSLALTVAPSFPMVEDLRGDQGGIEFKLAATLEWSF